MNEMYLKWVENSDNGYYEKNRNEHKTSKTTHPKYCRRNVLI